MRRCMTCLLLCTLLITGIAPRAWASTISVLRPGDQGTAVEALQRELQKKGYYTYPEITGYYGAETELAIILFQNESSLGRDGVAGKYTLRALFGKQLESVMRGATLISADFDIRERAAQEEHSSPADTASDVMKNGMMGEDVRMLQERLVALGYLNAADGEFGNATEAAVRTFQTASGLKSDGEAGPKTLSALQAEDAVTAAVYASRTNGGSPSASGGKGQAIADYARQFKGYRYIYGTAGPNTFDCSGLVLYVYRQFGITLPHTSRLQGEMGTWVDINNLQAGDLVFFDTIAGNGLRYDHVGIYLSGGQFIQAASSRSGVIISSLLSGYYRNTFVCGRRLL